MMMSEDKSLAILVGTFMFLKLKLRRIDVCEFRF